MVVRHGLPADEICRVAGERDARLTVIGPHGRFGFVELAAPTTTEDGFEEKVPRAARTAEPRCLVAQVLKVPIEVAFTAAPTQA
jgi:hypothetical protein